MDNKEGLPYDLDPSAVASKSTPGAEAEFEQRVAETGPSRKVIPSFGPLFLVLTDLGAAGEDGGEPIYQKECSKTWNEAVASPSLVQLCSVT